MIRSKQLEKTELSPVQANTSKASLLGAPSRSRLATVDGCSLSSPNPWDFGHSNNTTDITLPSACAAPYRYCTSKPCQSPSPVTVDLSAVAWLLACLDSLACCFAP